MIQEIGFVVQFYIWKWCFSVSFWPLKWTLSAQLRHPCHNWIDFGPLAIAAKNLYHPEVDEGGPV